MKQSFRAKKSLGQNFLINKSVCERIVRACQFQKNDHVLEIGPGQGALTKLIAEQVKHLYCVEFDRELAPRLKKEFQDTNVTVFEDDFLQFPLNKLPNNLRVVGNLPYNICAPILEKILLNYKQCRDFFITVQLEFGQRLVAKPNTKSYGSLSCFTRYHADAKLLFKIKNTSFKPVPKVQSCFLHLNILKKPRYSLKDDEHLFELIKQSFAHRRKTMINSLAKHHDKEKISNLFQKHKINLKARAENLTLEDFVKIKEGLN